MDGSFPARSSSRDGKINTVGRRSPRQAPSLLFAHSVHTCTYIRLASDGSALCLACYSASIAAARFSREVMICRFSDDTIRKRAFAERRKKMRRVIVADLMISILTTSVRHRQLLFYVTSDWNENRNRCYCFPLLHLQCNIWYIRACGRHY